MRENEIISAETDTVEVYNNIPSTRINYVEPNYTTSYTTIGSHGVHSNEMLNNLEDYSTFVNLSVEVRGRTINVTESEDNHTYIINWESQQGKDKISFLQGSTIDGINKTSNVLTTDYTNVFFDDVQEKPSTELFGIESIDIEYNNMMVPQVTMKFVDVRGVALFSAEEMASFRSENGMEGYKRPDVTGSFFKSFFTMPYPIYKLVVKGYYGKPTTYTLTVQDFRASFQSNTGNFNVTVKFVGFQFSFLGDITLNSLMAAPYSDWIGADYWKAQVDAGRFVFDDGSKMLTLSELYGMIQKASVQASAITDSSPEMEVKTELDINNDALNGVAAAYKTFSDAVKEALSGYSETKDFKFGDTNVTFSQKFIGESGGYLRAFAIMVPDSDSKKTLREILGDNLINKIYKGAETLNEAINEYNGGNENNMVPTVNIDEIINLRPKKIFDYANGKTVITFGTGSSSSYPELENWMGSNMTSVNSTQITDVKILDRIGYHFNNNLTFDKEKAHGNLIEGFGLHSGIVFISSDFLKIFNSEKENNDIKIQENEAEIAKVYQKAIIDTLGFVPSVGNITKLVMAHFETYVHMIRETAISIESSEPQRTMSSLGVGPDNLPDFKDGESAFVPPFPKVTEQRTNSDGSMINEESWIGNLNGNWLEKELVNGFINGVKIVNTQIEEAAETTPGDGTVINTNTPMEIPVSPMDMILSSSPYGNSANFNDVSDVVGLIGLRMLQIFGAVSSGITLDKETLISPIARAEARNFRKFFPNPSNEFLEKLGDENNKFADIAFDMLTNSKPEYVATYGKDNKYAWSNPRLSTVEGLVDSDFSLKTFGYSNGGRYLPVQGVGFEKINSDLNPTGNVYNKPSNGESYIATKCIDNTTNNNECANNLIKIDPFPQRYKMIIEERVKGDDNENIAEVKNTLLGVFDFTKSKYSECYSRNDFLFDLMEGTPTCKKDSYVFPETRRTETEADKTEAFGNGYEFFDADDHGDYDDLEFETKVNKSFWTDLDITKCSLHVINGINNEKVSLFGEQGYYNYSDYYHRAFLFLYALGSGFGGANGFINYKDIFGKILKNNTPCLFVPYASILMAGALYWLETNPLPTGEGRWNSILSKPSDFGLNTNVRRDVKNVFIAEFKKWVDEKFKPVIAGGLEIDFRSGTTAFFNELREMEDGESDNFGQKAVNGVEKFFIKHTSSDRFFKNYLTVDEDVVGPRKTEGHQPLEYGVLLGMRDKTNAAKEVTRVAMQMYALVTPTKYTTTDSTTDVSMNSDKAKVFLSAFCDELKKQYGEPTEAANGDNSGNIDRTKETEMPEDIRIGVYRYLKLLYDKWIAGDTIKDKYSLEYFFEGVNGKAPVFIFIDSFYHKIGRDFLVNIDKIGQQIDSCRMNEQYTLLSFLSVMCQDNKFNFFCINNFLDLSIKENLEKMFTPIPYLEMGTPSSDPNFIIQYPYEPSSHLDLGPDSEYKDDSFMINGLNGNNVQVSPNFPVALTDSAEAGYSIPAFGVSYGKMYQSYFTDIDVNMDAPMSTEQTFKAIYQIASMNNESTDGAEKNMTAIGQDLYTIYSNNSYTCNVRMMGCAWVQPLMYFCLTNVPMFKGTYYIVKVTHHIERGNMVTNFTGVRMANNMTRKVQDWCVLKNPTSTGGYSSQDLESMKNKAANVDNDCPYPVYPLFNNGGVGGAIPTEDLMMKTRDVIQKYNIKADTPGDPQLLELPLWETLAAMAWHESGIEGVLGMQIHAACQCNFWHFPIRSWIFLRKILSWTYAEAKSGDRPVSLHGKSTGKTAKEICKDIYFKGPAQLIGQTTVVNSSKAVREVYRNNHTDKRASSVTLTYDMLSKALMYCTYYGYDRSLPKAGAIESRPQDWWAGDFLFQHEWVVFTTAAQYGNKSFWELSTPPVKNDNVNKKEKEFIKALGRAVHDTCANSAIQGNVGFDEKTLTENTIRFTCDDKTKLPGVFDVCLNTDYFNYIEELRWMIPNDNGAKGNPSYIYVKASEKPGTNKIVGVYKEDTKGVYNSSEVNEQYAKSITKYLNKGGNAKYITTPISDDMKKGIQITDCNTLVVPSSDGLLYGGNYDGPYIPFDGNAQDRSNRNRKLITEYGFPQEAIDLLSKFGSKANQDRYKQLTKNLFVEFEYETRNGKRKITLHKKVAEAVKRAFEEIKNTTNFNVHDAGSGLQIRCVNNGNGRSNRASNHALGLAFDINAGSGGNPFFYKVPFKSKYNQEPSVGTRASSWCAQKICPYGGGYDPQKCIWHWGHPVIKILAKYGIGWGGDYGDTMHFSFLGGS